MNSDTAFVAPSIVGARPFTANDVTASRTSLPATPTLANATRRVMPTMAFSSIDRVLTADPVALPQDVSLVVKAVYKQVMGNAHLMESELAELASAESTFGISRDVREFVRAIAQSEGYKDRFFNSVSQYRAVELAFKHLLGRAPQNLEEYAEAMAVYNKHGYEEFVAWFVDSNEYDHCFGTQIVPYGIYKGCYASNELFNRSVAMRYAPGQSNKGRAAMLQYCVCSDDSPNWLSISKALPAGTEKGTGLPIGGHWWATQRNKNAPVRVATKIPGGVVFY